MADGREPDPLMLLLAVDTLPPVSFDLGLPGWAPTLELTAHVRARPAPGWLRVRTSTRNLAGGLLEGRAPAASLCAAGVISPRGRFRGTPSPAAETISPIAPGINGVPWTLELGSVIRLGPAEKELESRLRTTILADVCEALIGAIFVDGGYAIR